MDETWKEIPGHCGYEVSDIGNVRSLDRMITQTGNGGTVYTRRMPGKAIKPIHIGKYLYFGHERSKHLGIHVAVALAFIGQKPGVDYQVAHNDGNPLNNNASNIRWATASENAADKRVHGTLVYGEAHRSSKLSDDDCEKIRELRIAGVPARTVAKQFGICTMQAWRIGAFQRRAVHLKAGELAS